MTGRVMVRWLDDTVQTYERVSGTSVAEDGTILAISTSGVAGHIDPTDRRVVRIPLANVRWWGQPPGEGNW